MRGVSLDDLAILGPFTSMYSARHGRLIPWSLIRTCVPRKLSDMTAGAPVLTAGFWRTRRSAAIARIVFAVLLLAAMTMARIALDESSFQTLQADAQRRGDRSAMS